MYTVYCRTVQLTNVEVTNDTIFVLFSYRNLVLSYTTLTVLEFLGFNLVYCQYMPEYNSKHWGLLLLLRCHTFLLFLLEFVLSSEEFLLFLVFQHNGAASDSLYSFCRQSIDYHIVVHTTQKIHTKVWCSTLPLNFMWHIL